MKKRYLYALLFAVPGLGIALILAFLVLGTASGFMWLFLYGDDPWPAQAGTLLPWLFLLVLLGLWIGFGSWGFFVGRRLERDPVLDRRPLLWSAGLSLGLLMLLAGYRLGEDHLHSPPAEQACSDFCRDKGYPASGMNPRDAEERVCSCFDGSGRAVITINLDMLIRSDKE